MRSPARQRGFALLIVLWTMVLLALLLTQLTQAGRSETRVAQDLGGAAAIEAIADGAIYQGVFHLLDLGPGHWSADRTIHRLPIAGALAEISITDEAGLINPNLASPALLSALLRHVGADALSADKLGNAIAGWRMPYAQDGIGEDQYRAAGLDYVPPRAPFQSIAEVGLVLGMTPKLLAALAPHLSVFNQDAPDPAQADPVVLATLRDVSGLPNNTGRSGRARDVIVTATAVGPNGARFTRRAAIRLGQTNQAALYEILAWDNALSDE